jgi:8-oxo-dGTP diphosphatase
MVRYVCGFYFSYDMEYVTLILKNRPEWEKNLLNGIGGKIEPNEKIREAMAREMKEETGIETKHFEWINLIEHMERDNDYICYFLCAIGDEIPKTLESEVVNRYLVSEINNLPVIENLKHIIPAAIKELKYKYSEKSFRKNSNIVYCEPKPGMEYFLTYEIPANITTTKRSIPKGTIVTDVKLIDTHYEFIVKNTGVEERANYSWAFAENTPDNLEKQIKYDSVRDVVDELTKYQNKLHSAIKTLAK